MEDLFKEAVNRHIGIFNSERGRRKELNPQLVGTLPGPYRNFGRILEMGDGPAECGEEEEMLAEGIDKMAKSTIRALLRRKPRPRKMALTVLQRREEGIKQGKFLFRLRLPVLKRETIKA